MTKSGHLAHTGLRRSVPGHADFFRFADRSGIASIDFRSALFTASASLNTLATSGSKSTVLEPLGGLATIAPRPRPTVTKCDVSVGRSYAISSGVNVAYRTLCFVGVTALLCLIRSGSTDDTDLFTSSGVAHSKQPVPAGASK